MTQKATLPNLPYAYDALEPVISAEIMELHHQKHHNAYVTNYNATLDKYAEAEAKGCINTMISLQGALRFNGGGHINHSLFWENLAPINQGGGEPPQGPLKEAIDKHWGSLESLIENFNKRVAPLQGSGWGWLAYHPHTKNLVIWTCPNQDPLKGTSCMKPLLGIDVWEHAYYLQYKNARPEYLKNIWKVINWAEVAKRYEAALSCKACAQ